MKVWVISLEMKDPNKLRFRLRGKETGLILEEGSQECQPWALTSDRHRLGGRVSSHCPPFLVSVHMCVYRKYVYMRTHTNMHTCTCAYECARTHAHTHAHTHRAFSFLLLPVPLSVVLAIVHCLPAAVCSSYISPTWKVLPYCVPIKDTSAPFSEAYGLPWAPPTSHACRL